MKTWTWMAAETMMDGAPAGAAAAAGGGPVDASAAASSSGSSGDLQSATLGVEDEQTFDFGGGNSINIRVLRVEENDAADENDDDVEIFVRTGQTSQETTIEEFRSEFIDDYEVVAEEVRLRIHKLRVQTPGRDHHSGEPRSRPLP